MAYAVIAAAVGTVAACNGSKSADQVARDTAAAEQTAATNAARVQQKADARIASVRADVRDEQRDLAHVVAVEGQKVTDQQATDDYKLALARCEGVGGATQQACRDQASADYHVAKARAEQEKAGSDPKP